MNHDILFYSTDDVFNPDAEILTCLCVSSFSYKMKFNCTNKHGQKSTKSR